MQAICSRLPSIAANEKKIMVVARYSKRKSSDGGSLSKMVTEVNHQLARVLEVGRGA
jgi:hypothetical protein